MTGFCLVATRHATRSLAESKPPRAPPAFFLASFFSLRSAFSSLRFFSASFFLSAAAAAALSSSAFFAAALDSAVWRIGKALTLSRGRGEGLALGSSTLKPPV